MNQVASASPNLDSGYASVEAPASPRATVRKVQQRPAKVLWLRFLRRARMALKLILSVAIAFGVLAFLIWQMAEMLSYFG